MAIPSTFERKWPSVLLAPISVANSIVTVSSTEGLHPKQRITLRLGALQENYEIKRVLSDTQLQVGPPGPTMNQYSNPVSFNGGLLEMSEQERNPMGWEIVGRAVYAEEPIVALRNILVNKWGEYYDVQNPLPVRLSDGSVNIGTVNAELEVQLSHKDNDPDAGDVHDSVRIGDGDDEMAVNDDGSINVNIVTGNGGTIVNTFNAISSVGANTITSLVTYTVPPLKKGALLRVAFGGDNIGEYELYKNGNLIEKARTWFSNGLYDEMNFWTPNGDGEPLIAGDVLLLKVQHYRGSPGSFEGRIETIIKDV